MDSYIFSHTFHPVAAISTGIVTEFDLVLKSGYENKNHTMYSPDIERNDVLTKIDKTGKVTTIAGAVETGYVDGGA